MRKIVWCVIVSISVLGGSACKRKETEKAGSEVRKTQEQVLERSKGASEAESKLTEAQGKLASARTSYMTEANARLAKIDAKIDVLAQKPDPGSQQMVTSLRSERGQVADRIQNLSQQDVSTWSDERWRSEKRDTEDAFAKLENDIDRATK